MTNDELLYAMNECAATFEESRAALETRLKGKRCAYGAYGVLNKSFIVDRVSAHVSATVGSGYAYVGLEGRMYKKDGTFHRYAKGRVRFDNAKFLD